jgi:hypothetical protein
LLVFQPSAAFDIRIKFEFVCDAVLLAYLVVVAHDFFAGWVERGPIWILGEAKRIEDGGYVTV